MSSISNNTLSDNLNQLNINIQELVDYTDILIKVLEGEEVIDNEKVISAISILHKLLKNTANMTEKAIECNDGLT